MEFIKKNLKYKAVLLSMNLIHYDYYFILKRQLIQLDLSMTSTQRCFSICDLETESLLMKQNNTKNLCTNTLRPSQIVPQKSRMIEFPSKGEIIFNSVMMKYRKNLDYALKNISFKIQSGQKVGFVGRTGSGKSSIIQALFRMTEIEDQQILNKQPTTDKNYSNKINVMNDLYRLDNMMSIDQLDEGIFIDGQNIKNIDLNTLRRGISIIPQAPFIFSGTVRSNIDPFNQFQDKEIEAVLHEIGLLGRVMMQKQTKIIVLDEATASCDINTEDLISKIIKEKFKSSTIITIAHRLYTIADYDIVFVMENGCILESGNPYHLLQDSQGVFYQMAQSTGKQNQNTIFKLATENYKKRQQ